MSSVIAPEPYASPDHSVADTNPTPTMLLQSGQPSAFRNAEEPGPATLGSGPLHLPPMIPNPLPLSVFPTGVLDSPFVTTELLACPLLRVGRRAASVNTSPRGTVACSWL